MSLHISYREILSKSNFKDKFNFVGFVQREKVNSKFNIREKNIPKDQLQVPAEIIS